MSSYDIFLKQALVKYKNPDFAKRDILHVFSSFNDLRPKLENYVFNDGTRKSLLQLDGTIPVTYKGSTYNIPIRIWIIDTHPNKPPMVYVRPTSTMLIKPGRFVDQNGKVDLPYLKEWAHPNSDLIGLVQILTIVFAAEMPVYTEVKTVLPLSGDYLTSGLSKYKNSDEVKDDILNVCAIFSGMRPFTGDYVFPDGSTKNLLQLRGSIPITFKRKKYNTPICIWIMDKHPFNPPLVYVIPPSTVKIRHVGYVDQKGKVDISYLREWKYPDSDIVNMVHMLAVSFSKEPPLAQKVTVTLGPSTQLTASPSGDNSKHTANASSAPDGVLFGSDEA